MALRLQLKFDSWEQLLSHLGRYVTHGLVIVPDRLCPSGLSSSMGVEFEFVVGSERTVVPGLLQKRVEDGVVVRLSPPALRGLMGKGRTQPADGEKRVALGRLAGMGKRPAMGLAIEERVRKDAEKGGLRVEEDAEAGTDPGPGSGPSEDLSMDAGLRGDIAAEWGRNDAMFVPGGDGEPTLPGTEEFLDGQALESAESSAESIEEWMIEVMTVEGTEDEDSGKTPIDESAARERASALSISDEPTGEVLAPSTQTPAR